MVLLRFLVRGVYTMCFGYDVYQVLFYSFFFAEVLFHPRVIGACPVVTTYYILFGDELM